MDTIEELLYYCREIKPAGALLLSGEWGCGKTYIIDYDLKEALKGEAVVLRISLFGITLPEEIHAAVKSAWMEAYYKIKGFDGIAKSLKKFKRMIETAHFLPETLKGIASTDLTELFTVNNKIADLNVVLVFDDLERCQINSVDVLGIINDYCENGGYHTIIVANQDKMAPGHKMSHITGEIHFSDEGASDKRVEKTAQITLDLPPATELRELSYTEIKEKIIQRTVQYIPNYEKIVHAVIADMKCDDPVYRAFIQSCETELLELFAPDRDDPRSEERVNDDVFIDSEGPKQQVPPHNIRSLKCAIQDFHRVYRLLTDNEIPCLSNWLYSFTSYIIAYKADLLQTDKFSDESVRSLYPAFQSKYMLSSVKRWIFHGIWDEELIQEEIAAVKSRAIPRTPAEIIKSRRIMDIDDEVLQAGFPDFLALAYDGNLTLNEYVLLIENSSWARQYQCPLPTKIDWNKIKEGVDLAIGKIKTELPEGQILYSVIGKEQRDYFTDDEWSTYERIADFALGNEFMFFKNRKLYVEKMEELGTSAFLFIQNKQFDCFNEEMARVTAQAFACEDNAGKEDFVASFRQIWMVNIQISDIRTEETIHGFLTLKELLQENISPRQDKPRTFSVVHTEKFIKVLDELIEVSGRKRGV